MVTRTALRLTSLKTGDTFSTKADGIRRAYLVGEEIRILPYDRAHGYRVAPQLGNGIFALLPIQSGADSAAAPNVSAAADCIGRCGLTAFLDLRSAHAA